MLGAIAGDVIGSVFEGDHIKSTEFPLFNRYSTFTDDTVLTVAVAYSILKGVDYTTSLKTFGKKYPYAGYGRQKLPREFVLIIDEFNAEYGL